MQTVILEVNEGIAFITLNREEKLNAFNREMALALQQALDTCRDNETVRVVYLSGGGKAFSAGQDLAEVVDPNGPGLEKILSEQFNPIISRLRNMPKPVIAAINGVAAGAGANIAFACDIVVASASSVFIQAFSRIGLIPDSGGTYILPRLIGWQRASALMMLGDKVSAEEAERIGMIYKYYPDDSFTSESKKIAMRLSQMPTLALALTKDALNHSIDTDLDDQLNYEDKLQTIAGKSYDFGEGMRAFLEKRNPVFRGS